MSGFTIGGGGSGVGGSDLVFSGLVRVEGDGFDGDDTH